MSSGDRQIGSGQPGASAFGAAGASDQPPVGPVEPSDAEVDLHGHSLRIVDLTHELTSKFNFQPLHPRISLHPIVGSGACSGMNLNLLSLVEHTGTHIDAPRHFSKNGASLGELPIRDLVVPLAVLDFREDVKRNPNAMVTIEDIERWEKRYGPLPKGCCVVMWSGWDPFVVWHRMTTLPRETARQSPGFSPEVVDFLLDHRDVKGIAVDVLSIDTGTNSPEYPVHQRWLHSGRWGIEGLTNLAAAPASGAILVVGAAPIEGATGIPIRAMAIF